MAALTSFANLKQVAAKASITAALVVALVASATPAQANPSFNFSFSIGNGGFYQPQPVVQNCMNNRRIANGLNNQGYRNVQFVGERYYGYPEFQGWSGGWVYQMQVNRCTGQVYNVNRVQPVVVRPAPFPSPVWPHVYSEPRPFGGNSDIIYRRN